MVGEILERYLRANHKVERRKEIRGINIIPE